MHATDGVYISLKAEAAGLLEILIRLVLVLERKKVSPDSKVALGRLNRAPAEKFRDCDLLGICDYVALMLRNPLG